MSFRIGVDVGGTATDAVLLDGQQQPPVLLAKAKVPTTADVLTGIAAALRQLQQQRPSGLTAVQAVFLGTTQFVNAVVQRQGLAKVFVVRLCGTATKALPPFLGIPADLQAAVVAGYLLAAGGLEFDGVSEISQISEMDVTHAAEQILQLGAQAVVVSGVHATLNPWQELAFEKALRQQLDSKAPGWSYPITLSHQVSGRLGLLERESAAVLNASLQPLAAAVIPSYRAALDTIDGLKGVPLYLSGNDGTLITSAQAQQHPILTFKSGPVNSLRGAAALTGLTNALVMDIGGTTTDTAAVVAGLPRMSGSLCDICGVTTSFRMPLVSSIGLGGGSLVSWHEQQQRQQQHHQQQQQHQHHQHQQERQQQQQRLCKVGPVSVGSALTSSSMVCGGHTLTASDVAVLLLDRLPGLVSRADVPKGLLADAPYEQELQQAWEVMQQQLAAAVDAAKTSNEAVPLGVVGGGAGLCGDSLPGVSRIITPEHAEVANAVGAAIPSVAGVVDTLLPAASGTERQNQIQSAVQQAVAAAVAAGAVPASVEIVEQEEVAVSYGPSGSVRLHVKAVGELHLGSKKLKEHQQDEAQHPAAAAADKQQDTGPITALDDSAAAAAAAGAIPPAQQPPAGIADTATTAVPAGPCTTQPAAYPQASTAAGQASTAGKEPSEEQQMPLDAIHAASDSLTAPMHSKAELATYRPFINDQGMWELSDLDLDAIAVGAQILGAGGGGSARLNRLKLQHALAARGAAGCDMSSSAAGQCAGAGAVNPCRTRPCVLSLAGLQDDAMLCDVGGMGAPTVSAEKLDSHECAAAVRGLAGLLQSPLTALLCAEVGGGNALEPFAVGMELGLPVVDADLMGRAFPELQMSTAAIAGVSLTPAAIADDKGNVVVMAAAASAHWAEKVFRAACTEMGCSVGLASSAMSGRRAKEVVVPGSLSLAWSLGLAVLQAHSAKKDPVAAVLQLYQGQGMQLLQGKVVDVERKTDQGFVRGRIHISPLAASALATEQPQEPAHSSFLQELHDCASDSVMGPGHEEGTHFAAAEATAPDGLVIEFQNENLIARAADGRVLGCVPDLICVLDSSTGAAVATEEVRYGLLVTVVVLPAHPLLRTSAALQVVGPAAFGYEGVEYIPVGNYPLVPTVHEPH